MRGYNRGFRPGYDAMPPISERVVSALSYLTLGFVGFIWMIIMFVIGRQPSYFARYHIFQSIFLSILLYIFNIIVGILLAFIKIIPFIGDLIMNLVYYLADFPLILGYSLIHTLIMILIFYLTITSFMGKLTEIPWISNNIKSLIR